MCGIFGVEGHPEAAKLTYLGLYALQHRGQESAGIVTWDEGQMHAERGMGEVADIFSEETLGRLPGARALGHTRYSTAGTSVISNAQPIVVKTSVGPLGIVHNGNLANAVKLREELEADGSIFQTSSDTEVILHLMARNPRPDVVESLLAALREITGAYSILLISEQCLIAARDPHGFRPLAIGRYQDSPVFASESCAFDLLQAERERELEPGEVLVARGKEVESFCLPRREEHSKCLFEHVYLARPDSEVFDRSVSESRLRMGARLAVESGVPADLVVPVPDSGLFAALGYSRESGIPFEFGLIRNHYVGRTFIEPKDSIRHFGVRVKLNPVRELIEGRRIILVDDSIVRGTTSQKIVRMVREAGASEVHLRIPSPPTAYPCHYGINTPTREELIASSLDVEGIREFTGADSLAYLSLDGLIESVEETRLSSSAGGSTEDAAGGFCTACWTGKYPVPLESGSNGRQGKLFPLRVDSEGSDGRIAS